MNGPAMFLSRKCQGLGTPRPVLSSPPTTASPTRTILTTSAWTTTASTEPGVSIRALDALASATVEDMASVHALRTSIPARELCELLNDVEMRTEAAAEAKRLLHSWDCRMDRDRPEPTIFSAFHDALAEAYSASILGPLAEEMAGETGRGAPSWYGRTKSSLHDKLKPVILLR